MTTLATMTSRIASEIKRSNLNSEIDDAITSAVKHYARKFPLWFAEDRAERSISASARYFLPPTDFAWHKGPESLLITAYDSTYPMQKVRWAEVERDDLESPGSGTGIPSEWARASK